MGQTRNVDRGEPWPNGRDRQEDQTLPPGLTYEEQELIASLIPKPGRRGVPF